jgi:hypothetical protein
MRLRDDLGVTSAQAGVVLGLAIVGGSVGASLLWVAVSEGWCGRRDSLLTAVSDQAEV